MNQLDKADYYRSCFRDALIASVSVAVVMIVFKESADHILIGAVDFSFVGWWHGAASYWKEQAEL